MGHKKQNPNHNPNHRRIYLGSWKKKYRVHKTDNDVRKYNESEFNHSKSLEDLLRAAIEKERDEWRTPYCIYEDVSGQQKKDFEPCMTIRERLALDDAGFRHSDYKYAFCNWNTRVRVPSLKRSNTEWENFYRTFPYIAIYVALGTERFCDGAKLKYIPLFKRILDEVWPEDLTRWTETQYEDLIRAGRIANH